MLIDRTLQKTTVIHATTEAIWDALINPAKIKEYLYGTDTECDWKEGSPLVFRGQYDGHTYEDRGTILDIEPGRRLSYSYWSSMSPLPDLPENYATVSFQLLPANGAITLQLTQRGFTSEEGFSHSDTGWDHVLQKLKEIAER